MVFNNKSVTIMLSCKVSVTVTMAAGSEVSHETLPAFIKFEFVLELKINSTADIEMINKYSVR